MHQLLSNVALSKRLADLALTSERIDIAVAWIGKSDALTNVLEVARTRGVGAVSVLVGVGGYVTHPDALTAIRKVADLRVYEPLDGSLFHPKLYIFHTGTAPIGWVGSANLTKPGFSKNLELVLEVEDIDGSLHRTFEELWKLPESISGFDIENYRAKWEKEQKKRPSFLKKEAGSQLNSVGVEVLQEDWTSFVTQLNDQDDFEGAIRTLDAGYNFVRRDWSKDLSDEEDQILRALGSFTAFGNLKHIPKAAYGGPSEEAINRRRKVGEALARLISSGEQVDSKTIGKAFAALMELKHCGRALASRLLLFTRPDSCVVVNRKSVGYQGKAFKVKLGAAPTGEQYEKLIDCVRSQAWWRANRPADPMAGRLWEYRAAMTDVFAFREWKDNDG